MKITVAICTWNRSRLLKQTLTSLVQCQLDSDMDWEVLVVDNNSTDNTKQIVDSFANQLPVTYCFESQQGHSICRNVAIDKADSDLIVWTDNDVRVDSGWLHAYVEGAKQNPKAAFFGGKIIPLFENAKPDWLEQTWDQCKAVYAARDLGDEEFKLEPTQFPYGANFAVRTDVQRQFRFDAFTGRVAGGLMGEDEIDVLKRMVKSGHHGIWLPKASLQHIIPADRANADYVRKYFEGQGEANVFYEKRMTKTASEAKSTAKHNLFWYRLKRRFTKPNVWVSHLICGSIAKGEYRALQNLKLDSKTQTGSQKDVEQ